MRAAKNIKNIARRLQLCKLRLKQSCFVMSSSFNSLSRWESSLVASFIVSFIAIYHTFFLAWTRLMTLLLEECKRVRIQSPCRLINSTCEPINYGNFLRRDIIGMQKEFYSTLHSPCWLECPFHRSGDRTFSVSRPGSDQSWCRLPCLYELTVRSCGCSRSMSPFPTPRTVMKKKTR